MKNTTNKSIDNILRDTQHNSKAQEVFLKLLSKQKKPANAFVKVRSQTWNQIE